MMQKPEATPPPEAELQALIDGTLRNAFPGVKLRHEKQFSLGLGHGSITVDGVAGWALRGKADIIVYQGDRPLAVVELKRSNLTLTNADRKQLLTYAAQLSPRPPMLILSNGSDILFYDAHDGGPLDMTSASSSVVRKLFQNAAKLGASDLAWTMETLLGTGAETWAGFVRSRTSQVIARLSGSYEEVARPFIADTLFVRRKAYRIAKAFRESEVRVVMVTGAPLIGKSNLLRELAVRNGADSPLAVLFVRAGGGGAGLFQRIANLFSAAVEWPFNEQDARNWVRRLSNASGPKTLVIAIDDLVRGSKVASDLEELADIGFGPGVRIVATVADGAPRRGANGRDPTALEDMSVEIELGPLDDPEFEAALRVLGKRRVRFTRGATASYEYRLPWVLRAMLASSSAILADERRGITMAATLGPQLIADGRERLAMYGDAQRGYRLLARDAVAFDVPPNAELSLAESEGFIVRRDALLPDTRELVGSLIEQGWLIAFRHSSGYDILVPRAPEMYAGELAEAISHRLEDILADGSADAPSRAGRWLAEAMDMQFLGDVIGAQAVGDLSARRGGFPVGILSGLLECEPRIEEMDGTYGLPREDGTIMNVRIKPGEMYEVDEAGKMIGDAVSLEGEIGEAQASMGGWMILGQLAMWAGLSGILCGRP